MSLHRIKEWVARPRRANGYAVIASILLVAGVIVLSVRWASIDHIVRTLQKPAVDDLAQRCADLHDAVMLGDGPPWTYTAMEQAAYELSRHLQIERVVIFDLTAAGLSFAGASNVETDDLPATGHVMYADAATTTGAVSLFLVPNRGELAVRPTLPTPEGSVVWIRWAAEDGSDDAVRALLGSDADMVYVLVSRDAGNLEAAAGRIGRFASGM